MFSAIFVGLVIFPTFININLSERVGKSDDSQKYVFIVCGSPTSRFLSCCDTFRIWSIFVDRMLSHL